MLANIWGQPVSSTFLPASCGKQTEFQRKIHAIYWTKTQGIGQAYACTHRTTHHPPPAHSPAAPPAAWQPSGD
eukprot:540543-Pelagomonas_calceolata.AAC.2